MAREFSFSQEVQSAAHLRQSSVCALCAMTLAWQYDSAHPVYPVDSSNDAASAWRQEVDNCVILCNGCFTWTSDGGAFPSSSPTSAEEFVFSHGSTRSGGAHREWAVRMMGR
ncbi:MAG: hypothetical protein ABIS67_01545 [Candidatus Eisenbacteria bacterium]